MARCWVWVGLLDLYDNSQHFTWRHGSWELCLVEFESACKKHKTSWHGLDSFPEIQMQHDATPETPNADSKKWKLHVAKLLGELFHTYVRFWISFLVFNERISTSWSLMSNLTKWWCPTRRIFLAAKVQGYMFSFPVPISKVPGINGESLPRSLHHGCEIPIAGGGMCGPTRATWPRVEMTS